MRRPSDLSDRAEPAPLQRTESDEATVVDLAPRLRPVQQRAKVTVELILDAAAALLEDKGIDGFNTNVLAERAGVAVRSVYRYFPNKLAVIVALVERNYLAWEGPFESSLRVLADPNEEVIRAYCELIECWINHFGEQRGGREIRRAMAAVPELRAIDLADGDVMARRIVDALRERGIETPVARLEMIVRMGVTTFDALFDDALLRHGEVSPEVIDEIELLLSSYLRNYLK